MFYVAVLRLNVLIRNTALFDFVFEYYAIQSPSIIHTGAKVKHTDHPRLQNFYQTGKRPFLLIKIDECLSGCK
jgi:hypothetical protein